MKRLAIHLSLMASLASSFAADTPKADLDALVAQVRDRIQRAGAAGKQPDSEDFAKSLAAFDQLLKKYEGQKSDEVAKILLMKSFLYAEVLSDAESGLAGLREVVKQFPKTESAKVASATLEHFETMSRLQVGKRFPDFKEKDLNGDPLSVGKYQGKVVLVDFWATWCGPCVAELPVVLAAYEKYHARGFEIIGISLDRSESKLVSFTKSRNMPWPQYFDGKGWENKLAGQYGVESIPATFLIDQQGVIAAKDLRGPALEAEIKKLLETAGD